MYWNLPNNFIYSAYRLDVTFTDDLGNQKCLQGTCFALDAGNGATAIVTNRHLLELGFTEAGLKYKDYTLTRILVTGRRPDDSTYSFVIDSNCQALFSSDYNEDVALFLNPTCHPVANMNEVVLHYHFGLDHLAGDDFFQSELQIFDTVAFSGFPSYHDVLAERPIVRGGRIASDPRFNFHKDGKPAGRCIAYEAFSHEGASGSPVYAPAQGLASIPGSRDGRLIGINAGHIKADYVHHVGISYFYRSSVIIDIINNAQS